MHHAYNSEIEIKKVKEEGLTTEESYPTRGEVGKTVDDRQTFYRTTIPSFIRELISLVEVANAHKFHSRTKIKDYK